MSKEIMINQSISTRTYFFENKNSRSYITDEKNHHQYLLEGLASDVWNIILKSNTYKEVFNYTVRHNIADELDEFLFELEYNNLIKYTNKEKHEINNNHKNLVNTHYDNYDIFNEEKSKWLYENNFLDNLVLQLSYKCNLCCKHCFNDKTKDKFEISLEDAKRVIDEAYDLGITTVGITGGECTINKNFLEIVKYIRKKRLSLIILTNGQHLYDDSDFFNEIIKNFPTLIKLSLYSMNPKIHDKITGTEGSQRKTVNIIKKLREENINVTINFLQLNNNIGSYEDILKFAKEINAKAAFSSFFVDNPKNNNSHLKLSYEQLVQMYSTNNYEYSNNEHESMEKDRAICRASQVVLSVNPELNVQPCNDFEYTLGNLGNETLKDIWKYSVPKFREIFLKENLKECFQEDYCKYCSYCPSRALYDSGLLKKSYISCEHAKALNKSLELRNKEQNDIT